MINPVKHPAWQRLAQLATARVESSSADPEPLIVNVAGLHIDLSKQRIDAEVLDALLELADQAQISRHRDAMFSGELVNTSEQRAALHTALRAHPADQPEGIRDTLRDSRQRMAALVDALRDGTWRGYTNKPIRQLVHIGIGGSHLGPELVVEALADQSGPIRTRFLANVDGHPLRGILAGLDPETTLFVIVSKSFGTLETRVNASTVRSWFLERSLDPAAVQGHFVAITANTAAALEFGIPDANILPFWDWVGGRFSLWSPVGLPIAVSLGNDGFHSLLEGGRQMDRHFHDAAGGANAPLLMALAGIWNSNFLGAQSHAVLCYDQRLARLVEHLQQLEMESNGKSIRRDDQRSEVQTAPIVWGGVESDGQHAFHQLLHQGNRAFSADFIACITPSHGYPDHHRWLLANCLAQGEALLAGTNDGALHERVPGKRSSTTILIDRLTPERLGALLALYEHKVFCQGMIWGINPFDQWGVEFGKRLGETLYSELRGEESEPHDSSTHNLINQIRTMGSTEQT